MTPKIAIVDLQPQNARADQLAAALHQKQIAAIVCPALDARERLRWIMDLEPADTSLCLIIDASLQGAAAALQALAPGIPALIWASHSVETLTRISQMGQTAALVSFADSPEILLRSLEHIFRRETAPCEAPEENGDNLRPAVEKFSPASNLLSEEPAAREDVEDLSALRELERLMATAKSDPVQHHREPVTVQQAALDFSLPLRAVMSAAQTLARAAAATEVMGSHAACAVCASGNIYADALDAAGITQEAAAAYISPTVDIAGAQPDVVVSDEMFAAVARAKEIARQVHAPQVRVYDFLLALFESPAASVGALVEACGTTPERALEAIIAAGPEKEASPNPFFQPSSLDQAGFYEFDQNSVQDVSSRLKDLPAFQKASQRVAEQRSKDKSAIPASSAPGDVTHSPVAAAAKATAPAAPEKPEILRVDDVFPSVDIVEQTADLLLEGHLIAFPSDVMLALAADATNRAAVKVLRDAAGLSPEKPLGILINSTAQLKHLVRGDLDALEPLFDNAWPGSLTLIFHAAGDVGPHLNHAGTLAVRQPADSLSLAILSMLGRPLAVTSWDQDAALLNGKVAAILKSGQPPLSVRTTVIDVRTQPWQVIREGIIPAAGVLEHQPH